jgi:DNA-binding transcriptional LysR family regulator
MQIKDLEDQIGFPISVRNRDGVRITPAGQIIIAYAQEALSARVEVITMARAVHRGELQTIGTVDRIDHPMRVLTPI